MFTRDTVFVIGAGASSEAGLPVGGELARAIAGILYFEFERFGSLKKGDWEFLEALRTAVGGSNDLLDEHLQAARRMSQAVGLSESIDNYIDRHRDERITLCGKLAIAHQILLAERKSRLALDPNRRPEVDLVPLEDTWYGAFARILFEGVPKSSLSEIFDGLTVVSFNYDRCLATFLQHAIARGYSVELDEAAVVVAKLRTHYPYGWLGPLRDGRSQGGIRFGASLNSSELVRASANLRTYSEQLEDETVVDSIRDAVSNASNIVFLGFAFQRQNLRLLTPVSPERSPTIFGTAFGFSNPDREVIVRDLLRAFHPKRAITDKALDRHIRLRRELKCGEFLAQYRRSLAA